MISRECIKRGIQSGKVRFITDPNSDSGTVCSIGNNWFYFGDEAALYLNPDNYLKIVPIDNIVESIYETLGDFCSEGYGFKDEYDYYESILCPKEDCCVEASKSMSTDYDRFLELRRRVMAAVHAELERESLCKSYEGTFELLLSYPSYFEYSEYVKDKDERANLPDAYILQLHCYVLGPHRHYEWRGETLKEALDRCEADVKAWEKRVEV